MVEYKCLRCGYKTDRKNRFREHLEREKICKPEELDIPIEIIRETYNEKDNRVLLAILYANYPSIYQKYLDNQFIKTGRNNTPEYAGIRQNTPVYQELQPINEPQELYVVGRNKQRLNCKYCNKVFSSINTRCRHENHRCKEVDTKTSNKMTIENIIEDRELIKQIETYLSNKNSEPNGTEGKVINTNTQSLNNHSFNTTNNTTNNNNITNNNNNILNIQQNTFGNEKFDYIKNDRNIESKLEKLADTNTKRFFIELFKIAFFSKKHPENKTFAMDSTQSLCIKILKELPDKWIYASKDDTIYKKIFQILSWIVDETDIVTENTKTEKQIDDVLSEKKPTIKEVKKIFETMEILHYKNKKLEEEQHTAKLLNEAIEPQ